VSADGATRSLRVGSVVINTSDPRRAADFWSAALGYRTRPDSDEDWAMVTSPDGGTNLAFDRSDRTHLDLYETRPGGRDAEVERLIGLGAKRVEDWPYPEGADFVVLEDPVGNLFCVVDAAEE
jgi:catechol 2,3-dioxygenase-like lactoylglutathione lyase family enzyme